MAKKSDAKGTKPKNADPRAEAPEEVALTKGEQAELGGRSFDDDTLPNEAVRDAVASSRGLAKSGTKLAEPLLAKSELDDDALVELKRRAGVLERAETRWQSARRLRANPTLVKLRVDGEASKKQAMRTLRYFLRHNPEVQTRLDLIAHGTGDDDLVDDLRKLGALVHTHRAALVKAKEELGEAPQARLRALAASIEDASQDQSYDAEAEAALSLRNRAFWQLDELDAEVRAAGRYVFAHEPKKLAVFLLKDTSSHPFAEAGGDDDGEWVGEDEDAEAEKEAGDDEPVKEEPKAKEPKAKEPKAGGKKAK